MGADGDTGSGKRTGIIWQAFDKEIKFRLILGDIEWPGVDFDQKLAGFFVSFSVKRDDIFLWGCRFCWRPRDLVQRY
jgi:hypothetical protein